MSGFITAVSRNLLTWSPAGQRIELVAGLGVRGDALLARRGPASGALRGIDEANLQSRSSDPLRTVRGAASAGLPLCRYDQEQVLPAGVVGNKPTEDACIWEIAAVVGWAERSNPTASSGRFQQGLMAAMLDRDRQGKAIIKSGIMGIVLSGGAVRAGDPIEVELPPEPHQPLGRV